MDLYKRVARFKNGNTHNLCETSSLYVHTQKYCYPQVGKSFLVSSRMATCKTSSTVFDFGQKKKPEHQTLLHMYLLPLSLDFCISQLGTSQGHLAFAEELSGGRWASHGQFVCKTHNAPGLAKLEARDGAWTYYVSMRILLQLFLPNTNGAWPLRIFSQRRLSNETVV